jgi:hypothetical protein
LDCSRLIIAFALFSFFLLSFLPPLGSTSPIPPMPAFATSLGARGSCPCSVPSSLFRALARSRARSRQNMDEVGKIKEQIAAIWDKAREAQGL